MALNTSFSSFAKAVVEWLDNGNYAAFSEALEALDAEYMEEFDPIDPGAPRDARIAASASQYAAATRALSEFRLVGQLIEQRRDMALAELIQTVTEPTQVPLYWQKLIKRIQAAGIVQRDVHPSSRALADHLAQPIRAFNTGRFKLVDETYSDTPIGSWLELPREFAGFQLIDVEPDDPIFVMKPIIYPLPPSTDVAFYTINRIAPPTLQTRRATYAAWIEVIEDWAKRTNQEMRGQQPAIWALLLGYRIPDDSSNVSFASRQLIVSPWHRDRVVMIDVVEDDVPL